MPKSNEEFIALHVDTDKFLSYKGLQELFETFKTYHGGKHAPGGEWFRLSQSLGNKMIMDEEIYKHFGEKDMLTLIKASLQPLFDEVNHKEQKAPLFGHSFGPFQNVLSRSAKLGFTSIYKYMIDNVNPMEYDIDCMDLHVAIKYQHEDILDMIIANTDDTYGDKGSFTHRIRPETKSLPELQTLSPEMKEKLSNHFSWLDVQVVSANLLLDTKVEKWKEMSDDQLKELIHGVSKGEFTDKEFDTLKSLYKRRLERQLEIVKRQLEIAEAKG